MPSQRAVSPDDDDRCTRCAHKTVLMRVQLLRGDNGGGHVRSCVEGHVWIVRPWGDREELGRYKPRRGAGGAPVPTARGVETTRPRNRRK